LKTELSNEQYQVTVIGAGFAGIFTALSLCEAGYEVLLVETNSDILMGSSRNECYKLHTGVHYIGDYKTARQCLLDSINFAREFAPFILGDIDTYLRRGRYYLMSNALFSEGEVRELCEKLKEDYVKAIRKNPANKIFGEPEDFIKYISPEEYPYVSRDINCKDGKNNFSKEKVILGIEIGESQIDFEKLKLYLKNKLQSLDNLTLLTNNEVQSVNFADKSLYYNLGIKDHKTGTKHNVLTEGVINCAWQNIEKLNKQLGFYQEAKIIRVKASILVKLPRELQETNTCIFFAEPYCSFTNLGDGTAIVTYEPVTNVGAYMAGSELKNFESDSDKLQKALSADLNTKSGFGKELSEGMLNGAKEFIPLLATANILDIRVGHVKIIFNDNLESCSTTSKKSIIHQRREKGIEEFSLCYLSHSGMTVAYTLRAAKQLVEVMRIHFLLKERLTARLEKIKEELKGELLDDDKNNFEKMPIDSILYFNIKNLPLSDLQVSQTCTIDHDEDDKMNELAKNIIKTVLDKRKVNLSICGFFNNNKSSVENTVTENTIYKPA